MRIERVVDAAAVHLAADLFDGPPLAVPTAQFLAQPGHHLLFTYHGERAVGMISGVETTHPDKHQVRRWNSWHRFTTLALAALAILAICAAEATSTEQTEDQDMIRLTVNEIRRLINVFRDQPARSTSYRLHWSGWRRQHQARAKRAHYARRLTLELQP
ncbi:hypothetical protein ACIHCQ_01190 [Streptomyces sp. NPDC052236]|uniref:hypothetical protein n=1 Tax=Streptomyces sp. NPDC052236 TaxID=3365686 RepID=UPI0037CD86B5